MKKSSKLLAGAISALVLLFPATATFALDDNDKAEIRKIIRSYLLENPELMLEVQQALEAKQQQQAKEQARLALVENHKEIFESENQANVGNLNGDVTVVEFFDYNCGFCQRAMDDMNVLLSIDPNIKFVMKELPILSPGSVEASRVSTAVYRNYPDKYLEFHNRLLGLQGEKNGERALEIVESLEMDRGIIEQMAGEESVVDTFRENNRLATSLGINGTPSYVIGDEVIFGALGHQVLKSKIDNVRKCGSTVCS